MDLPTDVIGKRLLCDGEYGTVLYYGEVQSTTGIWLGIEWDNPARGKHDGSYASVKYFETRHPTSGSFIRPKKAEFGRSFTEAVQLKYGELESAEVHKVPQKFGKERVIELIGMEKIRIKQCNYENLREVNVTQMMINEAGNLEEFIQSFQHHEFNIILLDLSSNLVCSWVTVADIVKPLTFLETLDLSKNRIAVPNSPEDLQPYFKTLTTLILNKMSYSWEQILKCALMWPNIQELALWANEITSLQEPPSLIFNNLRTLSLQGNPISSWGEICKLGTLNSLQNLLLDEIGLTSISFPDVGPKQKTELFPNLLSLSLKSNKLSQWKDVSELNKLTKLELLKVTKNPITWLDTYETVCQMIIARISSLSILDGIEITRQERRGAEIDYLKFYYKEWLTKGGNTNPTLSKPNLEFLEEHPRYPELLAAYGSPDEEEVTKKSVLLKNNLISIEIYSSLKPEVKPISKRVPVTMTVGKLKALMQRLYKVNIKDIKLGYLSSNDEGPEVQMDNDLRELSYYSIDNDSKVYVQW